jgi:hypothetical protein
VIVVFFELYPSKADAQQIHQQTIKQFLVILMVMIALTTVFVAMWAGGVVNAASPSPATSTAAKTSETSPAPHATTPIPSVSAGTGNQTSRGDDSTFVLAGSYILTALVGAGGLIAASTVGAGAAVTAALIGGWFGIIAASIGALPGMIAVGITIATLLGLLT